LAEIAEEHGPRGTRAAEKAEVMSETTPARMQRLIADAFDKQGWEYDLTLGPTLVAEIEHEGTVDAERLVRRVPAAFIERNRTTRSTVAAVIDRAVGGHSLKRDEAVTTLVFADNRRYEVRLGRGAQIHNSNLNVGEGMQVNVDLKAREDDILAAVESILRAALAGDWNEEAARDLASVIDSRDDIDLDDVRELAAEVVQTEQPKQGRVKALLGKIAVSGLGGALGTGLSAGLGTLLTQLPI
jgi:hypothetical protein